MSEAPHRILYCHCRYAQVVPAAVKEEVLRRLCDSEVEFEAVPDLCELSARRDPALARIASGGPIKIAACFPRAVKWLFASAGASLESASTEVLNMRSQPADEVVNGLFATGLKPNLPSLRPSPESAAEPLKHSEPSNLPEPTS